VAKHQKLLGVEAADYGLIFAGDFNETEEGAVCKCLTDGGLNGDFRLPSLPDTEITKKDFTHEFALEDLYAAGSLPWCSRPATFCAPPEATAAWGDTPIFAAVDFIFYSYGTLRPIAIREPFSAEQLEATASIGIPSPWHFSDHVPIGGIFEFVTDGNDSSSPPEIIQKRLEVV
jgi:hypothetical protein